MTKTDDWIIEIWRNLYPNSKRWEYSIHNQPYPLDLESAMQIAKKAHHSMQSSTLDLGQAGYVYRLRNRVNGDIIIVDIL